MKNIYKIALFLFLSTPAFANRPAYLESAATAWTDTLNQFGRGLDIANALKDTQATNIPKFLSMMDVIAYNDSALNLYHITAHINHAMGFLSVPDMGRRPSGKTLAVTGGGFADFADYDANNNSDFKTDTYGFWVHATGYIGNGFSLGVGYTGSHGDTKNTPIDTTAETNSITIFTEYMATSGIFLNMGINGGTTRWKTNKTIAGIADSDIYNTDFYAGQINTGVHMGRGTFAFTPHVGVRYLRTSADRHSDAAIQTYHAWWYNLLTASGGLAMQYAIPAGGAIIIPKIHVGGTYDAISNGTDDINVALAGGQQYAIPVDTPHRTAFVGGLGILVDGGKFDISAQYTLDARSGYTSHSATLGAKFIF